jgi:RND family efflux transporter MFP subunit
MNPNKGALDGLRIDRTAAPKAAAPRTAVGVIGVVAILVILVTAVIAWKNKGHAQVVRTLAIQEVSAGGSKTLLNASGYVTARRQATVSSKVTGKVVEVLVEEGMKVEAGQILARVDASNTETNLRLAEAQLESTKRMMDETKASLEQADHEYRRITLLEANKVASQSDLDKAAADAKTLKARLDRQVADVASGERQVDVWKQQMDDTIIRAPFSGIVTTKNAQAGEIISPVSAGGGFTRTGICTIVDMNSLEIEVDVNESYINRVEAGQRVESTLDAYLEWHIPSKVIAIIPTADRQKATVKVRVGFDKLDQRILPDMGVKVGFQSGSDNQPARTVISVPKAAIRKLDGHDIAWVVQNGRVERRAVGVGASRDDDVTIVSGLSTGEKIVIDGPQNLADGDIVTEAKQ